MKKDPVSPKNLRHLDIAPVWSGHPVGFALLTHGERQFVGFYDAERRLTLATRTLDSNDWHFARLPQTTGWDSHNFIEMAVDGDGHLLLCADMHVAPLIYFRTTKPLDIETFERVPSMTGKEEDRCTYPHFLRGTNNEIIFTYRYGRSGSGNQIYNIYNHKTQTWRRLLDAPLTDGRGKMNAYFHGPTRFDDGRWHLCWVWRDTPDCRTNHDPSYARSKDLVHWETVAGEPLTLPITIDTKGVIVDHVPSDGGVINTNNLIGFDTQGRVIISYQKHDAAGATQLYNARWENGTWKSYKTSNWTYRWNFEGWGTIQWKIWFGSVQVEPDGSLSQWYKHVEHGEGIWRLDETMLKPIGHITKPPPRPTALNKPTSELPGMQVNWADDRGQSPNPAVRYVLRWETLGANRDKARESAVPPPSMLCLYQVEQPTRG